MVIVYAYWRDNTLEILVGLFFCGPGLWIQGF